jgi:transcriptional regulator GlxA family with amidase domain
MTRALFLILPGVELLDPAGPLQALHEAGQFGAAYEPRFCSPAPEALTDQGPLLARLEPLMDPAAGDLVFIPGSPAFHRESPAPEVLAWLRRAERSGARIFSICTGAFLLADAGLLDGRECTTTGPTWRPCSGATRRPGSWAIGSTSPAAGLPPAPASSRGST